MLKTLVLEKRNNNKNKHIEINNDESDDGDTSNNINDKSCYKINDYFAKLFKYICQVKLHVLQ